MSTESATLLELGFQKQWVVSGDISISDFFQEEERCGIYILHFANGEHYVGQATDVVKRYAQHCSSYDDINDVSFKPVSQDDLTREERSTVYILERHGFRLRNILISSFTYSETKLDKVIFPDYQIRWLNDCEFSGSTTERLVLAEHPDWRQRYSKKYQKFLKSQHASDAITAAREYVRMCIPDPKKTEGSFWAVSCMPDGLLLRINVGWQTAFDLWEYEDTIACRWYLTRDGLEHVMKISLEDLDKHEMITLDLGDEYPEFELAITTSSMSAGGENQAFLYTVGLQNMLLCLDDADLIPAIRRFNLNLMKKGVCPFVRYHCIDLADQLIE